ncbi:signal peptidase I Serine peptidase. MEROPS family S26A [Faunimonas pinastri]|uniref:Signal peptidase I n=1 Tax=Faunimonas pinastri TaxID=1855383 RepID=A0A1H9KVF3_9HYPH|nr:signal peptidase I [Faunimonas pinastri]SER02753.1 signal peptidase I Serine peptidase. MEROPS family S26A [Faunimonas pinastri]
MSVAERRADTEAKKNSGGIGETIKVIVQALVIALVFRTFLFHPFNIPSESMLPTLKVGDYLFVSKFSYGYSRYSFPVDFSFIHGRVFGSEPKRGDVVVFREPSHPDTDFIKRCIGLPGDKIQMRNSVLYINGEPVKREQEADFDGRNQYGQQGKIRRYRETLPNGVSYDTLDMTDHGEMDNTLVYEVPPDHYFMMGDNRDNSEDSRYLDVVGYVPAENLVGRAERIFFSVDSEKAPAWQFWRWPWTLRLGRIFTKL